MKFGSPTALMLATLIAACASPDPKKTEAPPPPPPPKTVKAPPPPVVAPAPAPALSAALRSQLGESGAQLADGPEGTIRLMLAGSIAFTSGSDKVSQPAQPILDRIAAALKARPGWRVLVEGHTDSVGRELYNEELSRKRAQAVVDALVERGLDAGKLEAVGRGEHVPIADNATAKGRAANRRIELVISPAAD